MSSDKTPVQICNDIVNLAASIKNKDIKVTMSEIVERKDTLNEKVILVNECAKNMQNYWTTNNQTSQYQSRLSFKSK